MTFFAYLHDAWTSVISNKLRSFLSMLGIIIGVSSVVCLMAVGSGAQKGIMDQMASLINNNLTIQSQGGYTTYTNDDVKGYVKAITLTPELAVEIEDSFPELSGAVTYGTTTMGQVTYDNKLAMSSFAGVPIDYLAKMEFTINGGSNFRQSDFDDAENVAVVNKNVVDSLFPAGGALGQKITYNNKEYTIIGTLSDASIIGMVYIPITTYRQRIAGNQNISAITIRLEADDNNALWQANIQYFLLRKYGAKHLDLAGFSISSTAAIGDVISSSMGLFNILLGAIGGISLLVGGIGVMNIMLVSVTERTREIGIRKAIGALNKDIIQQFLIESILVTFFGGILAIIFSILVSMFVNSLNISYGSDTDMTFQMAVTVNVMITAFTLTFLVGILSGILPARKAANLKPIDALRFE
ncbi:hypothetical protein AGMMS50249_5480 [candidate division SR1 bacterium]|nr:hypothetical protein AGMMS50249_5480 [candidate division SR1 bacterium]